MYSRYIDLEDGVKLYDDERKEIVSWTDDEWIEDPDVVYSILNAVIILTTKGPDELKRRIK